MKKFNEIHQGDTIYRISMNIGNIESYNVIYAETIDGYDHEKMSIKFIDSAGKMTEIIPDSLQSIFVFDDWEYITEDITSGNPPHIHSGYNQSSFSNVRSVPFGLLKPSDEMYRVNTANGYPVMTTYIVDSVSQNASDEYVVIKLKQTGSETLQTYRMKKSDVTYKENEAIQWFTKVSTVNDVEEKASNEKSYKENDNTENYPSMGFLIDSKHADSLWLVKDNNALIPEGMLVPVSNTKVDPNPETSNETISIMIDYNGHLETFVGEYDDYFLEKTVDNVKLYLLSSKELMKQMLIRIINEHMNEKQERKEQLNRESNKLTSEIEILQNELISLKRKVECFGDLRERDNIYFICVNDKNDFGNTYGEFGCGKVNMTSKNGDDVMLRITGISHEMLNRDIMFRINSGWWAYEGKEYLLFVNEDDMDKKLKEIMQLAVSQTEEIMKDSEKKLNQFKDVLNKLNSKPY